MGSIKLFISHSSKDVTIATLLVDAIGCALNIPEGALRCTSVPHYSLDFGGLPREALRDDLSETECVVAMVTPHSLSSAWCLCELGAAWISAKTTLPLLAGSVSSDDIPGPLGSPVAAWLNRPDEMSQFLISLQRYLKWETNDNESAIVKLQELSDLVERTTFEDTLTVPAFEMRTKETAAALSDDERWILRKLFAAEEGMALSEVILRRLTPWSETNWVKVVERLKTKELIIERRILPLVYSYSLTRPLGRTVAEACVWDMLRRRTRDWQ